MDKIYELIKENEDLKKYVEFLEAKCKEYEKHYDIEIQCRNSLQFHSMPKIITDNDSYDMEIIRIPERKFMVGCQDLSKIRKKIEDKFGGYL